MNIVWIEDFGGGLDPTDRILRKFFGKILPRAFFDGSCLHLINNPNKLADWCRAKKGPHFIEVYSALSSILSWLKSDDLILQADLVLIDLNLESADDCGTSHDIHDIKRAGTYIYKRLLRRGFPAERMAFMTAHDRELSDFREECKRNHDPEPKVFRKSADQSDLDNWLDKFADDSYIHCRRGILDAIAFCRGRPQNPEFSSGVVSSFFVNIEQELENRSPAGSLTPVLDRFVKPWEASKTPRGTLHRLMKYCGNWVRHDYLATDSHPLTHAELAFIALLAFRGIDDDPGIGLLGYEELLFKVARRRKSVGGTVEDIKTELCAFLRGQREVSEDSGQFTGRFPKNRNEWETIRARETSVLDLANLAFRASGGSGLPLEPGTLFVIGASEEICKGNPKDAFLESVKSVAKCYP